jgi:hypothetical protein
MPPVFGKERRPKPVISVGACSVGALFIAAENPIKTHLEEWMELLIFESKFSG